jgi:hypothetical protein
MMLNLTMLFTLMMLPGLGVLAISLIVSYFESKKLASLSS